MLLEKIQYTESHKTEMYFFKDVDYKVLDEFQTSDITLAEGEKANGYKTLTNTPKVVNTAYINEQIAVIDTIIADKYYNNWGRIVGDVVSNYQGLSSITSQIGETEREQKNFLIESVQYMGQDLATLQKTREDLVNLGGGTPRDINLNDLKMLPSGYVYTTIKPVEKIVDENMLPYVNLAFLKSVSKIDRESETLLKVINNDHVYVAFTISEEKSIMGENKVLALKAEMMGTDDPGINQAYYDFLVKRVDQLYYFPKLRFKYDDKDYSSYFIDEIKEGDQKIIILMIKDYVNDFSNIVVGDGEIYIQDYKAFEIPQSAVFKVDGETKVDTVTKGYFSNPTTVTVEKNIRGKAILKSSENPGLSSGMRIKIYP
ncbi:MAG: hypothetical protein JJE18_00990 [Eubacteriaceae bacterium]|nr:hypothetical protein [Eubacteriaceae bacterium]